MSKLFKVLDDDKEVGYYFDCPGCGLGHTLIVQPCADDGVPVWKFNGNLDSPTFRPGIHLQRPSSDGQGVMVCNLFVTDGWLYFWNDCSHELSGLSVAMEDVQEGE